jgi:hypothetical protein
MHGNDWLFVTVSGFGVVSLIGFFATKTKGFGKYTTATLLLILLLSLSTVLYVAERLEGAVYGHLLFGVLGFAGGLFTGGKETIQ